MTIELLRKTPTRALLAPLRQLSDRIGAWTASDFVDDRRIRRGFDGAAAVLLFFVAIRQLWNPPPGVVVQGMIVGGLTALIAFGVALVYRANRIINFAQGDLGAVPAALTVLLIVGPGVPYLLALPIGIGSAIVLGVLFEWLFIRRFFKAPRLILTVVTIFLAQVLAGAGLLLPRAFDIDTPPQSFPSPFDFSFEIRPIVFRGNDIIAMLMIPIVIVALVAFFRYTSIGIAVRASAESADRAALLGVPVKRIHTIVWVIVSVLATLAMFLRAGIIGLPIGTVLGPGTLLRALAAGVIGRMQNLPVIFVAAMGLGIVEQSVVWHTGTSVLVDPILFIVVIGALLFQRRRRMSRAEDAQTSSWQATKEIRPIPYELAALPEVKYGIRGLIALVAAFFVLVPVLMPESKVNLMAVILVFGIIGLSLVILTGWAGQVSLGQIAFVGIGAAVGGSLTAGRAWDLSVAVVAAGLVGAVAAMIIGLPAVRIRGLFLAVATLAFALATSSYLLNPEFVRFLPTERIDRPALFGRVDISTEVRYYYFTLVAFAFALIAVRGLRRSRTGRVLIGTRENERGAQAFGINPTRAKLTAFAMSGFLASYAGAIFVHHQQSLGITAYAPEESLRAFTMVVIGGLGSIPGALLGAAYVRGAVFFLPPPARFLASGIGALIVLMILPGGLGSVLYAVRDWGLRKVAARRQIIVPSLVADVRRTPPDTSMTPQTSIASLDLEGPTRPLEAVTSTPRRRSAPKRGLSP